MGFKSFPKKIRIKDEAVLDQFRLKPSNIIHETVLKNCPDKYENREHQIISMIETFTALEMVCLEIKDQMLQVGIKHTSTLVSHEGGLQ